MSTTNVLLSLPILFTSAAIGCAVVPGAIAYDNGPQSLACDYSFEKREGTDTCLIVGSGSNQGVTWVVFEVLDRRFRYRTSTPSIIEEIDDQAVVLEEYSVSNSYGQCRPGGREADIYDFESGDRICIYW
ncbi:MAG: hypothetical protein AAF974_03135 [Cyanobacteria bacterium P01_E01_bin.34]